MGLEKHQPDNESQIHKKNGNHEKSVREEVHTVIRSQGLRATKPRVEVLVVLHEQARPMTHEQVMSNLPEGTGDKASVWRLLADLSEHGVLRRMDLGDRLWRYELHDSCRSVTNDHPHLLCEDCGEVTCLPMLEVRGRDGTLPTQLQGTDFRIRIMGCCAGCVAH
jgi:Fur family ferric uptake transcriptional regulator